MYSLSHMLRAIRERINLYSYYKNVVSTYQEFTYQLPTHCSDQAQTGRVSVSITNERHGSFHKGVKDEV